MILNSNFANIQSYSFSKTGKTPSVPLTSYISYSDDKRQNIFDEYFNK